jgi:hypothetical protein
MSAIVQGFSNQTGAGYQTVMGQYCKPRVLDAVALASGAFVNSTATTFVNGSAQTIFFNVHGTSSNAGQFYPLVNFNADGTLAASTNQIAINAESGAFFMHTVNMNLTGYDRKLNTGGTAGGGTFFGQYSFQVFWDHTNTRTLYVQDLVSGSNSASGSSNGVSTVRLFNNLSGNPAITVNVAPTTTATGSNATGYYVIRVASSGTNPVNWLAQINAGELCANLWA